MTPKRAWAWLWLGEAAVFSETLGRVGELAAVSAAGSSVSQQGDALAFKRLGEASHRRTG